MIKLGVAPKVSFRIQHDAALDDEEADSLPPGQAHWGLRKGSDFIKLPRRIRAAPPRHATVTIGDDARERLAE